MADQENKKKKSFFAGWLPKIILLIGIILVISVAFFGVELTLPSIVWALIRIVIGIGLVILMAKGIMSFIDKVNAPPKERMLNNARRLAKIQKPFYVKDLHIRGEDLRFGFKWGTIKGMLYIPNWAGKPSVDNEGHYIYTPKKDREGKEITDKDGNPIMVHEFQDVTDLDGEWLIVAKRGWWIFGEEDLIRAHINLVSELGHKVMIKTPNLLNIDGFLYLAQQWQSDIVRIKVQHQAEVLNEVNETFWDYLEHLSKRGVDANPEIKKSQILSTENMGEAPKQ